MRIPIPSIPAGQELQIPGDRPVRNVFRCRRLIYLGSAALIVPIAVRLGLGSVLGYLIAGCIIGPWAIHGEPPASQLSAAYSHPPGGQA